MSSFPHHLIKFTKSLNSFIPTHFSQLSPFISLNSIQSIRLKAYIPKSSNRKPAIPKSSTPKTVAPKKDTLKVKQFIYNVQEEQDGLTLQKFVAWNHNVSRGTARLLILGGKVLMQGTANAKANSLPSPDSIVRTGDEIIVESIIKDRKQEKRGQFIDGKKKESLKELICFENDDLLVIKKPNGLQLDEKSSNLNHFVPTGTPRLLDVIHPYSSGLVIIAKNEESFEKLARKQQRDRDFILDSMTNSTTLQESKELYSKLEIQMEWKAKCLSRTSQEKLLKSQDNLSGFFIISSSSRSYTSINVKRLLGDDSILRRSLFNNDIPIVNDPLLKESKIKKMELHRSKIVIKSWNDNQDLIFKYPLPPK